MKNETAWVIERHIGSVLHYWTGRVIDSKGYPSKGYPRSSDHRDAVRFARRVDAASMLTWHCQDIGNVVEHSWTVQPETGEQQP